MTAAKILEFDRGENRPEIYIGTEAETIRELTDRINQRIFKHVYVIRGDLVELSEVSGDPAAIGDDAPPLPIESRILTESSFASLLAHKAYCFKVSVKDVRKKGDDGKFLKNEKDEFITETVRKEEEVIPKARALGAVLSQRHWPHVNPLVGIVGAPVLRPNGSLLQVPGYDRATGLYLAPKLDLEPVPDEPNKLLVNSAKTFVLDHVLRDFPWKTDADRANYVGLLVANILRPYVRSLTPFGLISATTQSSGKSLLTELIGHLFGFKQQTYTRNDAELRKAITALLDQPARVIAFDNIVEGGSLDSPILAQLLTAEEWSDRLLGTNTTQVRTNDRLWLATGNNLRLGGDMATRTVLVRIDPNMPKPEERTDFAIGNLNQWMREPANRAKLLRALLILVMDWIAAGAKRTDQTMRQFTPWVGATGGFLAHHGIHGFLGNSTDVRELDEEDAGWMAFLHRWWEVNGGKQMTAQEVFSTAPSLGSYDQWQGDFITLDDTGMPPKSTKSLGKYLAGQEGRFHGQYVLRKFKDAHRNVVKWAVECRPEK